MAACRTLAAVCAASLLAVVSQGSEPSPAHPSAASPSTGVAANDVLPFQAAEKTLGNGLKVIVVRTGFPNIVSLQIPVNSGSRNEIEAGKTGFAHFFEHMMFRGTRAYPPDRYQGILTRAGARQNAY
ncbi:MAG: insulinase family protein, partial [Acidobacteriota bacterium]